METQRAKIRGYLTEHRSATARELFIHCRVNSPRKRISEMIRNGEAIGSMWVETVDELGDTVRYKRYYLE